MIERSIRKESFSNYEISQIKSEYEELFALVRAKFVAIEECYAISIPDDEIAYVVEMLGTSIHVI
jgi:transcriptional antiterminator